MRLIDADELEKVITQDWFLDILLTQTSKYDISKNLVNMIDSVPLAYDVDAVVEELEEHKKESHDDYLGLGCDDDFGAMCAYSHAIEIVKAGGNNDNR